MNATIFDIARNSYVDGPGIRTTVFFKGCNLRCVWCHNPESQNATPELLFYENKCVSCGVCRRACPQNLQNCDLCGTCARYCPNGARKISGKPYTVDDVLREVEKDRAFYESTGGGVTCSGGECMLQIDFLEAFLKACHARGLHTAVDTAGHVPYAYFERIFADVDLFLYDVKCMDAARHKAWTGVSNERILENLSRLLESDRPVWVRIPVIPSVNDTVEEMRAIRAFLDAHGTPARVELLPYHTLGEHKYAALGKPVQHFPAPDEEQMKRLRCVFEG